MIIAYHRPESLENALELLSKPEMMTRPMGGGTKLINFGKESYAVVDLQLLGLNKIQDRGNVIDLGAQVTLQKMLEGHTLPSIIKHVIRHEATYNLRQVATVAGTIVIADGRSPFTTTLLAIDAQLTLINDGETTESLGDYLPQRSTRLHGCLITNIKISKQVSIAYEFVARTPADRPIVSVAVCRWPSGRTRVALGGYGSMPALAFDGTESNGIDVAAKNAYSFAEDEWASAEYRQEIASILAARCLLSLDKEK
jgi:CO/xanthine dehydrogenase FAD-binding subunit